MVASLIRAWKEIWRFDLPLSGQTTADELDPVWFIRWLPAVGLVLGAGLWLGASLLTTLIQHRLTSAAVGALLLPALYTWLTAGRGPVAIARVAPPLISVGIPGARELRSLLAVQGSLVLQGIAVLILMLTSSYWWLLLMPVLGAAAYAELLCPGNGDEELQDPWGPTHWYFAGGVTLLIAGLHQQLVAGLFALLLAWLLTPAVNRFLEPRCDEEPEIRYRAAFYFVEILILWVGVLA